MYLTHVNRMDSDFYNCLVSGTINCDFEEKENDKEGWCNFHHKNNGDNSSILGFEWMRHSGKWIQDESLEGPYKGISLYAYIL